MSKEHLYVFQFGKIQSLMCFQWVVAAGFALCAKHFQGTICHMKYYKHIGEIVLRRNQTAVYILCVQQYMHANCTVISVAKWSGLWSYLLYYCTCLIFKSAVC